MAKFLFECSDCGHQEYVFSSIKICPETLACGRCRGEMSRIFESPQLVTQPDRLREDNKWWWVKEGQPYSMKDKLEQDKADVKRYEEERREWREKKEP